MFGVIENLFRPKPQVVDPCIEGERIIQSKIPGYRQLLSNFALYIGLSGLDTACVSVTGDQNEDSAREVRLTIGESVMHSFFKATLRRGEENELVIDQSNVIIENYPLTENEQAFISQVLSVVDDSFDNIHPGDHLSARTLEWLGTDALYVISDITGNDHVVRQSKGVTDIEHPQNFEFKQSIPRIRVTAEA